MREPKPIIILPTRRRMGLTFETFMDYQERLKRGERVLIIDTNNDSNLEFLRQVKNLFMEKEKELPAVIEFENCGNEMRVGCPDEDSEVSVILNYGKQQAVYSMTIEEAERLRDFLINHIENFKNQ